MEVFFNHIIKTLDKISSTHHHILLNFFAQKTTTKLLLVPRGLEDLQGLDIHENNFFPEENTIIFSSIK